MTDLFGSPHVMWVPPSYSSGWVPFSFCHPVVGGQNRGHGTRYSGNKRGFINRAAQNWKQIRLLRMQRRKVRKWDTHKHNINGSAVRYTVPASRVVFLAMLWMDSSSAGFGMLALTQRALSGSTLPVTFSTRVPSEKAAMCRCSSWRRVILSEERCTVGCTSSARCTWLKQWQSATSAQEIGWGFAKFCHSVVSRWNRGYGSRHSGNWRSFINRAKWNWK